MTLDAAAMLNARTATPSAGWQLAPGNLRESVRARFPARSLAASWPATGWSRLEVWAHVTCLSFTPVLKASQDMRGRGLTRMLDWLEGQPGETWQERWLAGRAEDAGASWREVPVGWLAERGRRSAWLPVELAWALKMLISADVIRPSLGWLLSVPAIKGTLAREFLLARDVEGFTRLRAHCDAQAVSAAAKRRTLQRSAVIVAAKGGVLADVTVGDVLELLDVEADVLKTPPHDVPVFYQMLHELGIFAPDAPARIRELRTGGQQTPEELIDRYRLSCRPVRDLLVEYLRERQPSLDYNSVRALAYYLGKRFWKDLELHHPGIDSLHLDPEIVSGWRQRLLTQQKTVTTKTGDKTVVSAPRFSYGQCLTSVRSFYLDLAQWAIEDPARWARWAAPCPIRQDETGNRKTVRRRKARMDARTRERLPVLPVLVRTVDQRRKSAETLLNAARQTQPGDSFTADGQTLIRSLLSPGTVTAKVWTDDPVTGKRRDLRHEEEYAFWAWAAVEVFRLTGVRIEELLEISHHGLVQYRLPTTGEIVPLLQIAPSKSDTERLLVVSPELADVLSTIIRRVREPSGAVPLVPAYDWHECVWMQPAPLLFQRRFRTENRAISHGTLRKMIQAALADTGLVDPADGSPLSYTPHDFRRIFITDAIMNGLPPHIAQIIAGHRDVNVTLGYKAIYPDEAIQAHLAFLARRRSLRPSEEYRTPTDAEWEEFLGHFERRKVSTGICGRAYSTPCIHEHACLRCSMHWPDPAQRPRITEIRDNLIARITEAEREGWLGEVEGLTISLTGANDKLAQIDRRQPATIDLGIPGTRPSQQDPHHQDR